MSPFVHFILRHRIGVLLACAAITAVAVASMTRARVGTSVAEQFLGERPEHTRYKELIAEFGNDEVLIVGLDAVDVLSEAGQERLRAALDKIEERPEVARVTSVLDAQRVNGDGGILRIEGWADLALDQPDRLNAITAAIAKDPLTGGLLMAEDGTSVVLIELAPDAERKAEELAGLVVPLMAPLEEAFGVDKVHGAGFIYAVAESLRQVEINVTRIFPVVALVLLLTVWLLFRRLWPAALALLVAMLAVVWMLGALVALDPQLHALVSMALPVVLIVAFSDVVHLCSAYLQLLDGDVTKEEAVLATAAEVGRACLLTSATTFVGFVSLAITPTPIMHTMALSLALGVAVALLLAVTVVPALFSLLPRPAPLRVGATARTQAGLDRLLAVAADLSHRRPRTVVLTFALASALAVGCLPWFAMEADFAARYDDDNRVSMDVAWFDKHFGGTNAVEVYVRVAGEGDLLDGDRLARIAAWQDQIVASPGIENGSSLVDLVRRIHTAMNPGAAALPVNRRALAEYLELFTMSGGRELERLVDFDRRTLRVVLRSGNNGARATAAVGQLAEERGRAMLGDDLQVEASGMLYLLGFFFEQILDGQRLGLGVSFIVIALMMMVGLRSIRVGALSMIPNLLPLLALAGIISVWFDEVDTDVIIIGIIAIGIGVDDTIHFLMRYRVEVSGGSPEPVRRTFSFAGRGIAMTTIILVAGFLPCAASGFVTMQMLGTLLPICLVVAFAADVLLIPAMIRLGWMRL